MKALDSFTVERLEEILNFDLPRHPAALEEIVALARIALAAKSAEPDYYIVKLKFNDGWGDETVLDTYETKLDAIKSKADHGGEIIPVYTTPQLNHPVSPEGWKLVPIEPTLAMLTLLGLTGSFEIMLERYANMLAAAPEPQNQQQNIPEIIPQGWIKCSDQMPEDDEFVRIWPLPDFGVELHVGQYIKFHKNGPGWFAQVYEYNYGVEFYPITVTHWMPLPDAPEKP